MLGGARVRAQRPRARVLKQHVRPEAPVLSRLMNAPRPLAHLHMAQWVCC